MIMAKSEHTSSSMHQSTASISNVSCSDSQHRDHDAGRLLQQRLELVEDLWQTVLKSECPPEQTKRLLRLKQLSDPINIEAASPER